MRELLDSLPLWTVLLGTIIIVLIAIEVGYRLGRWRNERVEFESEALLYLLGVSARQRAV